MSRLGKRQAPATLEAAEAIALQGLAFLAEEPQRLQRFVTVTGLDPARAAGPRGHPRAPGGGAGAPCGRRIAPARFCGRPRHCARGDRARSRALTGRVPDECRRSRPSLRIGIDLGGTKIEAALLGPDGEIARRHRVPNAGQLRRGDRGGARLGRANLKQAPGSKAKRSASACRARCRPARGLVRTPIRHGSTAGRSSGFEASSARRCASPTTPIALRCQKPWTGRPPARAGVRRHPRHRLRRRRCRRQETSRASTALAASGVTIPCRGPGRTSIRGRACWCGRKAAWKPGCRDRRWKRTTRARRASGLPPIGSLCAPRPAMPQRAPASTAMPSRLARGLAAVVNVFDPDVIVLGGGLSKLAHLYEVLPALMAPHIFADARDVTVKPPRWGDAGGVRGAAWLWGRPT